MSMRLTEFISSLIDVTKGWGESEITNTTDKLKPSKGIITWNSEGMEGGKFHSRILHVPSSYSGLTIGRGYDMKNKNSGKIVNDLTKSGAELDIAKVISMASGKYGQDAKDFISYNDLNDFEISQSAQLTLFEISYSEEEAEVKRICEKPDVISKYGQTNWNNLNPFIKEILVDLKFRGDYTGQVRKILQTHVVNNDLTRLSEIIKEKSNWPNVPEDRFKRRKEFILDALTKQSSSGINQRLP